VEFGIEWKKDAAKNNQDETQNPMTTTRDTTTFTEMKTETLMENVENTTPPPHAFPMTHSQIFKT
jgi:hypothetical protein